MGDAPAQRRYRDDAMVLGEIGRQLIQLDMPAVIVRLPRDLAEQALAAWKRDERCELDPEDLQQRLQRHRAATLALIGLSIESGGRWEEDLVEVPLDPSFIGRAIDAADDLS